jgi:hypothetical protein
MAPVPLSPGRGTFCIIRCSPRGSLLLKVPGQCFAIMPPVCPVDSLSENSRPVMTLAVL